MKTYMPGETALGNEENSRFNVLKELLLTSANILGTR
jgi:hypothetical protein